jgi:hypothetical protein
MKKTNELASSTLKNKVKMSDYISTFKNICQLLNYVLKLNNASIEVVDILMFLKAEWT